jgi:hypothetical protein
MPLINDPEEGRTEMYSTERTSSYKDFVLGPFSQLGFDLVAPDDHFLFLLHEGEQIAVYSQTAAASESIRRQCSLHMLTSHSMPVVQAAEPQDAELQLVQ